jgi:hypothetical protein
MEVIKSNFQIEEKNPQQYNIKFMSFEKATENCTDELLVLIGDKSKQLTYKWTNEKEAVKEFIKEINTQIDFLETIVDNLTDIYERYIEQ